MHWIGSLLNTASPQLSAGCSRLLAAVAFWGAVVLPSVALSVLVVSPARIDILLIVLAGNVCCLLVGHRHDPGRLGRTSGLDSPNREVSG